jgi:hypothetical protein
MSIGAAPSISSAVEPAPPVVIVPLLVTVLLELIVTAVPLSSVTEPPESMVTSPGVLLPAVAVATGSLTVFEISRGSARAGQDAATSART